jgi:hypothetical protein
MWPVIKVSISYYLSQVRSLDNYSIKKHWTIQVFGVTSFFGLISLRSSQYLHSIADTWDDNSLIVPVDRSDVLRCKLRCYLMMSKFYVDKHLDLSLMSSVLLPEWNISFSSDWRFSAYYFSMRTCADICECTIFWTGLINYPSSPHPAAAASFFSNLSPLQSMYHLQYFY